jgi:homoserine dehydrogenase
MKIALLGFGTVGSGVARIVDERCDNLEIVHILSLPGDYDDDRVTSDYQVIADDADNIDVVVEAMGGDEPARTYILNALNNGQSVVTANKAVVAAHLPEFVEAANAHGATLLVEATSGGGIPWIASLEKVKRIDEVSEISGILNGTSNYIIDRMHKDDMSFADALAEAQRLGYAEADPTADIDGYDVRNKTIISSTVAFDSMCRKDIPMFGIRNLTKQDMDAFAAHGWGVRLLARAVQADGAYAACVTPAALPLESVEANVPSNFNIATCVGTTVGPLKFYGQGAGSLPTGNAIVQDLLDLAEGRTSRFTLEERLAWEPMLLVGNFVVRTAAELPEGVEDLGDGLALVRGITPVEAEALLGQLLEQDPTTFMAAVVDEA